MVEFSLDDLIHPSRYQFLEMLYGKRKHWAKLVCRTSDGVKESYLVVQVEGLPERVIIRESMRAEPPGEEEGAALAPAPWGRGTGGGLPAG